MATLDPGKLTSVDATGAKINIIPAEVRGFFRKHRDWSQLVLLVIFLVLPWTQMNGHQTIQINIPDREFSLFGLLFKSHDAPLLFFVVFTFLLGLAFVTSVWGRVWCGWACPQTVFIDAVYRRIELWVEGNYIQRRKLRDEPLTAAGFRKKTLKWFLFFVVSSLIAHSFMAYFLGAKNLLMMMEKPPSENFQYFVLVLAFTGVTLFNFGWFREQFCVIMCPYGRMQGLLLDQNSLAVVYDVERGEPRKKPGPVVPPTSAVGTSAKSLSGDCVSCNRCVQVCPTGIDIRNGLQMECITCTACIDACDEIMEKVKKPKGLIRYETLNAKPLKLFKPRAIAYMMGLVLLIGGLTYSLANRSSIDFTIVRGLGLPYSFLKSATGENLLVNHFKMHIQNQGNAAAQYQLSVKSQDGEIAPVELTTAENPVAMKVGADHEWHFFLKFDPKILNEKGQYKLRVYIQDLNQPQASPQFKDVILIGPRP